MSRRLFLMFVLFVTAYSSTTLAGEKGQQINAKDPQARPLVYVMLAVLDSDVELFKFAFSQEVRDKVQDKDWPEGMRTYTRELQKVLGDYSMGTIPNVRFEFSGDEKTGWIGFVGKDGNNHGTLRLIKEGSAWKLNER